jgi:hypothetical protein
METLPPGYHSADSPFLVQRLLHATRSTEAAERGSRSGLLRPMLSAGQVGDSVRLWVGREGWHRLRHRFMSVRQLGLLRGSFGGNPMILKQ